jgi:hypothetical protein
MPGPRVLAISGKAGKVLEAGALEGVNVQSAWTGSLQPCAEVEFPPQGGSSFMRPGASIRLQGKGATRPSASSGRDNYRSAAGDYGNRDAKRRSKRA